MSFYLILYFCVVWTQSIKFKYLLGLKIEATGLSLEHGMLELVKL